ncbi:MAG: TonB-dependent receptor [Salibacteraceae bacterium]|nr:TonB-dependent receptor [Salibacteraceae bacterium]
MIRTLLLCFLFFVSLLIQAQSSVSGQLLEAKSSAALPFANVVLKGTSIGASSNEIGIFTIQNLSPGSYELQVSVLGFKTKTLSFELVENQTLDLGKIYLQEDMLGLNEIVITGTMRETFVADSPVKIDVITVERLTNNLPATNLMEGLALVNGVQEVVACGVCNTNSISINGLPGAYTAVLMDGSPIYGNLASVYGLNGIPTQMIDRIEVIKGPNSTLYGSEAIGGVINIITKKPEDQPLITADFMGTSHLEAFGNLALSGKVKKWSQSTGVNWSYLNKIDDANGDGFSDQVSMDRFSALSKWSLGRPNHKRFTITGKLYFEDRRNGVEDYLQNRAYRTIRGSKSVYGESIYTKRLEVFGTYDFQVKANLRFDYSFSLHDQDSYYGAAQYLANQTVGFSNLVYTKPWRKHTLLAGFTNRYQFYDDNTVATNEAFNNAPMHQYIPGIFAENEWKFGARITLLTGLRLEYYDTHGLIPAPRLSAKYNLSEWTSLRANFGTGFKIVNLFTEDHAFITGQREVVIEESLNPERSWNISGNFHHVYTWRNSQGSIDVDAFYTDFNNIIQPNYDVAGKIIYANGTSGAQTMGASINLNQQFDFPLAYNLGFNTNRAAIMSQSGVLKPIEFAPILSGVLTVNYSFRKWKLDVAYTCQFTGPMQLPEVYDLDVNGEPMQVARPTKSEAFALQNLQITKRFKQKSWKLYGGIQNLGNYKQAYSPLSGYNDPNFASGFSPYFDTSYAYSSLHGREFYLGVRFNFSKKNPS